MATQMINGLTSFSKLFHGADGFVMLYVCAGIAAFLVFLAWDAVNAPGR
jgi:hypothetical protein